MTSLSQPELSSLERDEAVEAHAHESVPPAAFFPGFDGLRAIAALMVLVTHVWLTSNYRSAALDPWLATLDVGVPVFFVISGFLLYRPMVAARFDGRAQGSFVRFWKRRALRIFPAYWVCLIIVSLFMYWGPHPIDSVKAFITHFFLLQIYTPDRVVNGPVQQSWTLAVEVAFYAFLPFYAWVIRRVRSARISPLAIELGGIAALYVGSVLYRLVLISADMPASRYSHYRLLLPGFLDQLALGMGIAVVSAWLSHRRRVNAAPLWLAGGSWVLAAVCYWITATQLDIPTNPIDPRSHTQFLTEQFFRGLFALFLVLPAAFAARRVGVVRRFLSARVMIALGLVSYGIYLWHEAFLDAYLHLRDSSMFEIGMMQLLVVVLVTTIPTAALSYFLIEKPSLRLKNVRLLPQRWHDAVNRRVALFGRFERILIAIAVGGMVLRVLYVLTERRWHFTEFGVTGDSIFYHRGAQLLADGKGFINAAQYDVRGIMQQDVSHPPLYMLWLTIPTILGFGSTTVHMLWTVVISVGTIVIVGYCGREMVGPRVGLIAAGLVAIYPNVWSHDGMITSETMAIFTATLTVWMGYRYWRQPSMRRALALGLAVGLAMAARSELALLVPFIVIPVVLATRDTSWADRWKRLCGAGAIALVIVGPWIAYNLYRFEEPVFLSNGLGITMLASNCDGTYYDEFHLGYWRMDCAVPTEQRIKAWTIDPSVAESVYRREALDYISHHKKRFAFITLVHWARYTGLYDLTQNFDQVHKDIFPEGREPWVAWSSFVMWLGIAPLAVAGAVILHRRRIPAYIAIAPIVGTFITITLTFHQNRYRASAETAFCLLAAVAIDALVTRASRRRAAPTGVADASDTADADGAPHDQDSTPALT